MTDRHDERRGARPPATQVSGAAPARRVPVWLHVLVLVSFLGLWTWKLLEPYPVPEEIASVLGVDWQFIISKCLHFGGYAFLTVLAVALPVPPRWRWAFVALLALHGVGTEIGQTFVPNRTGTRRDVLIDWAGIALGVLAWQLQGSGARKQESERAK